MITELKARAGEPLGGKVIFLKSNVSVDYANLLCGNMHVIRELHPEINKRKLNLCVRVRVCEYVVNTIYRKIKNH
jgi:hypothetical protein